MVKCKIALDDIQESVCGKTVCCYFCDERSECNNACDEHNPCEEQVEEVDALQVMEKAVPDRIHEITKLMVQVKKAEERIAEIKEHLLKAMEEHGIKKFENEQISFTYVAPSTRKTFDKKALEKDHPELDLSKYNKDSKVKASVRIQVK